MKKNLLFICMMLPNFAFAAEVCDLTIKTAVKRERFKVEVAKEEQDQEHGLMGRKKLPEREGMLFYFGKPRQVAMWMKDTLIPLDMLFIAPDNKIIKIAKAKPLSEKNIPSGADVIAVVELSGGASAKFNIKPGAIVDCPSVMGGRNER